MGSQGPQERTEDRAQGLGRSCAAGGGGVSGASDPTQPTAIRVKAQLRKFNLVILPSVLSEVLFWKEVEEKIFAHKAFVSLLMAGLPPIQ